MRSRIIWTMLASGVVAQTAPGRWMYPRATDLTSKEVQSYSDQELFWIIKNGIRFTGMPAFGKLETPDHIWGLIKYVRTLPSASRASLPRESTVINKGESRWASLEV